jgi:hypothetical protein
VSDRNVVDLNEIRALVNALKTRRSTGGIDGGGD